MKAPAFDIPEELGDPLNLLAEGETSAALKPDSRVLCLNRGRRDLDSMFNGENKTIPAGLFVTEFREAQHFKDRLVVPGTRNLEVGGHVSWITILGSEDQRVLVDPVEMHVPFTDEELQTFGEKIEAIDRSSVIGAGRNVTTMRTQTARAMSRSNFQGMRPQVDAGDQVSDAASEAADHVFEPPTEPLATRQAEHEAAAEGAPSPRPMRGRARR